MEQYDFLRAIGKGSFGKVYLVRHKSERKHYVMKVIKLKGIPKSERDATRNEVMLLQKMTHPNIVAYKDSFFSSKRDQLCIVMTYCDGGDLSQRVQAARTRLFKEDLIMHWFVQIALGMAYMHQNKVLHRDIKTQNIFLLGNGRLVLGDLGVSKVSSLAAPSLCALTTAQVLDGTMAFAQTQIGTPYYMSPELFKNKPYNHKSDVWALGCVLYELAALRHPFDATSLNGLASKIMRGAYSPINHKYSRGLRSLIQSMLATNPSARPSLEQVLRTPYCKKHLFHFIKDIVERSSSIGEGTAMFKAAAVRAAGQDGGIAAALPSGPEIDALRRQIEALGLQSVIAKAAAPENPAQVLKAAADPANARKYYRDQRNALSREQERRRAVETALERLRKEKELRAKQRDQYRSRQARDPTRASRAPVAALRKQQDRQAAAEQRRKAKLQAQRDAASAMANRHGRDHSRDSRGSRESRDSRPRRQQADRQRVAELDKWSPSRGSSEERPSQRQHEEQRKQALQAERDRRQQVMRDRQAQQRRDERAKQEAAAAKRKAEAEAAEARRQGERARAEAAIRKQRERALRPSPSEPVLARPPRPDDVSGGGGSGGGSKPKVLDPFRHAHLPRSASHGGSDGVSPMSARRSVSEGRYRDGDAESLDGLSAKQKVLARKEAKRLEEEAARKEALANAARQNVMERRRAVELHRDQYRSHQLVGMSTGFKSGGAQAHPGGSPSQEVLRRKGSSSGIVQAASQLPGAGAGGGGGNAGGAAYDFAEEERRLNAYEEEASRAVQRLKLPGARYDPSPRRSEEEEDYDGGAAIEVDTAKHIRHSLQVDDDDLDDDDLDSPAEVPSDSEDDEEDIDEKIIEGGDDEAAEREELQAAEHELRAELERSTMRCNDLKASMDAVRHILGKPAPRHAPTVDAVYEEIVEEEEEEEEEEDDDGEWEDEDDVPASVGIDVGVHDAISEEIDEDIAAEHGNTGRLDDRIRFTRQRCRSALGDSVFRQAYNLMKSLWQAENGAMDVGGESYADEENELNILLGADKAYVKDLLRELLSLEARMF